MITVNLNTDYYVLNVKADKANLKAKVSSSQIVVCDLVADNNIIAEDRYFFVGGDKKDAPFDITIPQLEELEEL